MSSFAEAVIKDTTLTFAASDFTGHYSDTEGVALDRIKVTALPADGTLKLSGTAVSVGQEIGASDLGSLTYVPDDAYTGTASFSWQGHDGVQFSTTVATTSVNVVDGTVIHGVAAGAGALQVDGGSRGVIVPDSASLGITGSLTLEAWVSLAATPSAAQTILSKFAFTGGFADQRSYQISVGTDNQVRLSLVEDGTSAGDHGFDSGIVLTPGEWTHIAAVYDHGAGEVRFYLNGEQVGPAQAYAGGIFDSTAPLAIGARADNGADPAQSFDGLIDEVRVWDTARTAEEIRTYHNSVISNPTGETSLQGYWNFNGVGGQTVADLSGNGNDGTLGANSSVASDDGVIVRVPLGNVLSLDGVDDFVDLGTQAALATGTGDFTYEAWIRTSASGIRQEILLIGDPADIAYRSASLFVAEDGTLEAGFSHVDGPNSIQTVNDGRWHHVAITNSNGTLQLYVDGAAATMAGTTTGFTPNIAMGTAAIGRVVPGFAGGVTYFFDGEIADVRIWDDARTAGEIAANRNARLGGTEANLVGYWPLDEGTGTTAHDYVFGGSGDDILSGATAAATWQTVAAPIFDGATATAREEATLVGRVGGVDPDGAATTFALATDGAPAHGSVTVNADGTFAYAPDANFDASDTFTVAATSSGVTTTKTITVNVSGSEDVPTVSTVGRVVNEDTAVVFAASDFDSGFSDPDTGDQLSKIKILSLPSNGLFTLNGTKVAVGQEIARAQIANMAFDPDREWSGSASFTWQAADTNAGNPQYSANTATMTITVNAVDDAPHILGVAGNGNGLLQFDGVDDRVTVADSNVLDFAPGSPFTIEAWIHPDTVVGEHNIVSKGTSDSVTNYRFYFADGRLGIWNPGHGSLLTTSAVVSADQWQHVAVTYDGATIRFYVDGSLVRQGSWTLDPVNTGSLSIGFDQSASNHPFDGTMDELRIWSVERTNNQIKDNADKSLANPAGETGLVGYWNFDGTDYAANTVADRSGAGNDGILGTGTGKSDIDPVPLGASEQSVSLGAASSTTTPRVQVSDFQGFPTTAVTVEAWVNLTGTLDGAGTVFSYAVSGQNNEVVLIFENDGISFLVDNDKVDVALGTEVLEGWHHVAATWAKSGGAAAVYIDGRQVVSGTIASGHTLVGSGTLVLGNDQDSVGGSFSTVQDLTGRIADARIWSDVRTTAEIQSSMGERLFGNEDGLAAYWRLDEGSGSTLTNRTGGGNNATLVSGSWANEIPPIYSSSFTMTEEDVWRGTVGAVDPDTSGTITYAVAAAPAHGTLTLGSSGTFTYTPDVNRDTTDTFTVQATRGTQTSTQAITVNFIGTEDAPAVSGVARTTNEDTTVTFALSDFSTGFNDPDTGDSISKITILSLPAHGRLALSGVAVAAGDEVTAANVANLTFEPDRDWNGTTAFTWTATDVNVADPSAPQAATNTATMTITVNAVDDAPRLLGAAPAQGSILFDGLSGSNGDMINFGNVLNPGTGSFTVELWADLSLVSGNMVLASKGNLSSTAAGWAIRTDGNGIEVRVSDASGDRAIHEINLPGGLADLAGWHHVALVVDRDAGTVTGYLDGSSAGWTAHPTIGNSLAAVGSVTTTSDFVLGGVDNGASYQDFLKGSLAEVRYWDAARTPNQIADGHAAPVASPAATANLMGYWTIDSVSGQTVTDLSGHGNNGALGANTAVGGRDPKLVTPLAGALSLDGTDDYVAIGDLGTTFSSMSVEMWVNVDAFASGGFRTFLASDAAWTPGDLHAQFVDHGASGQQLEWAVNGGAIVSFNYNFAGLVGQWTHVAVTMDTAADQLKLYVNGALADTVSWTANQAVSIGDGRIGAWAGGDGRYFDGQMGDVRIWDDVRTASEIAANHTSRLVGDEANLVGYWRLDEGAGTTAGNAAADGADGTIRSGASAGATWVQTGPGLYTTTIHITEEQSFGGRVGVIEPEAGAVTFSVASGDAPAHGTLALDTTTGAFTYTPDANLDITDSFTVTAASGTKTSTHSLTVTVTPVEDLPTVANVSASTNEDTALTLGLSRFNAGFADVDTGDALSKVQILSLPDNGTLFLSGTPVLINQEIAAANLGSVVFDPNRDWNGTTGFNWRAADTNGGSPQYSTGTATTTLTVNAIEDAPRILGAAPTGGMLSVGGGSRGVVVPDSASLSVTGSITLEAWLNPSATPSAAEIILSKFAFAGSASNQRSYQLYTSTDNQIRLSLVEDGTGAGDHGFDSGIILTPGEWAHVAAVYDDAAGTVRFFRDGAQVGAAQAYSGGIFDSTAALVIGGRANDGTNPADSFNGLIDDVRVWGVARTANQIADNYQSPLSNPSSATGLAGYWSLDGIAGQTVSDLSGNGNNGTLGANASVAADDPVPVQAPVGNALVLDGVDDYVDLGTQAALATGTGSFTYEAWIQTSSSGQRMQIVSIGDPDAPSEAAWFFVEADGRLSLDLASVVGPKTVAMVNDGMWHHVAVVMNSGSVALYIDGASAAVTGTTSGFTPSISPGTAAIGRAMSTFPTGWNFDGGIADVRIWDDARTAGEIAANLNARLTGTEDNLVGYFRLDEGSGTVAANLAAGGDDGTILDGAAAGATWTTVGADVFSSTVTAIEDQPFHGRVGAVDPDTSGSISFAVAAGGEPRHGTVVVNADGTFTYTPTADDAGADSFTVAATLGGLTSTRTISVDVANTNDAPAFTRARDLDGSGDFFTFGNPASLAIAGDLTAEVFFKADTLTHSAALISFAGSAETASENALYSLFLLDDGSVAVGHEFGDGSDVAAVFDAGISIGEWTHLAVVRDAAAKTFRLYVDGTQATLLSLTDGGVDVTGAGAYLHNPDGGSARALYMGDSNLSSDNVKLDGQIADVRIWNVTRSQADIVSDQDRQLSGQEVGLQGYWRFDEASGAAIDRTANGNDGAEQGSSSSVRLDTDFAGITDTVDGNVYSGSLLSTLVGNSIADPDSGALEGIAVTAASSANGAWQYSLNSGASWTGVGTVSDAGALLLPSTAMVRFMPNLGFGGTETITYRAWDQTAGAAGTKVDVSANGGVTAFSTTTQTSSIFVNAVPQPATHAVLANDNFGDNSLDAAVWRVVEGTSAGDNDSVAEQNGRIEIQNRELLVTQQQYKPEAGAPLHVTGKWTPTDGDDFLQVMTRTDADNSADTTFGGVANGIEFAAYGDNDAIRINVVAAGNLSMLTTAGITIGANQTYAFDILDDGTNLRFTLTEVGNGANTATATAASAFVGPNNFVLFTNREQSGGDHLSYLDDIRIERAFAQAEGSALSATLMAIDGNADAVSFAKATDPGNGSVVVNADGSFTYTPPADFDGTDSFTYTVTDARGASATGTARVFMRPVEDAPTVSGFTKSATEDTTLTFSASDFTGVFADPDTGDALSKVKVTSLPANGTLKLSGVAVTPNQEIAAGSLGNLAFEPDADWNGSTTFTYNAADANNGAPQYAAAGATVTINVAAVNDAPTVLGVRWGNVARLDGTDDIVTMGNVLNPGTGSVTVEAWVDFSSLVRDGGAAEYFLSKGNQFSSNNGFALYNNGANLVQARVSDGAGNVATQNLDITNITGWHHLAMVVDRASGAVTGYLDGTNAAWTGGGTTNLLGAMGAITNANGLVIGAVDTGSGYTGFAGTSIDDVRYWDVARTASEIAANYDKAIADPTATAGLKGYWTFEDVAGRAVTDRSGHGNDGTLGATSGVAGDDPAIAAASSAPALTLDGVNDFLSVSGVPSSMSALTWEAWVRIDATNKYHAIFAKGSAGSGALFDIDSNGKLAAHFNGWTTSQGAITVGQWTHVAVTYDGSAVRFYINGALDSSVAHVTTIDAATTLSIGTQSGDGSGGLVNMFDGAIADARMWSVARSAAEIAAGYNQRLTGDEAGLIGNWKLDEGAGTTAANAVDAGPGATLVNGPAWVTDGPLDDATGVSASTIALDHDTSLGGRVGATDVDNASLTYSVAGGGTPAHGSLTVASNGSFTYTPTAGYVGVDSFTVQASDGTLSSTKTISVAVRGDDSIAASAGALQFDGVDDHATAADAPDLRITNAITIEAWINVTRKAGAGNNSSDQAVVTKGATNFDYLLNIFGPDRGADAGKVEFGGALGSLSDFFLAGNTVVDDGAWHHIAGVYDGTTKKIYVDGVLDAEEPTTGSLATSAGDLAIGFNQLSNDRYLNGMLDEARVWNVARSAAEIAASYDQRLTGNETGLVAYYRFDDGQGTVAADATGNGHDAKLGAGSAAPMFVNTLDRALALDGSGDYVTVPTAAINSADITIESWVKWDGGAAWQRVFDFGAHANNPNQYMFLTPLSAGGGMRFAISNTSPSEEQQLNTAAALATGEWHHLAVTIDSTANVGRLYLDGALVDVNTGMTLDPTQLTLGANLIGRSNWGPSGDPDLAGQIDDFRIWNTVRTADQIRDGMNSPVSGDEAGLVLAYGFDEASGTTARDSAGHDHDGTIVGGATAVDTAPTVHATSIRIAEDAAAHGLMTDDRVGDAGATFAVASPALHGSAVIDPVTGAWTYTPAADYQGADSFTLRATGIPGSSPGTSDFQTVNVTVGVDPVLPANYALSFDGTDDWVSAPLATTQASDVTLEAWVKWDGTAGGTGAYQAILNNGDSAGDGFSLYLYNDGGTVKAAGYLAGSGGLMLSDFAAVADTWTHLALTRDGSAWHLYANGTERALTNSGAAANTPTDKTTIGANSIGNAEFFHGQIDEARIWTEARSQAEIVAGMTRQLNGDEAGLAGYWSFNQASGTTLADDSGNGNAGTVNGGAAYTNLIQITMGNNETYAGLILGADGDGDSLSYAAAGDDASGLVVSGNTFTYTSGDDGTVTASVDVTDDQSHTTNHHVTFDVA